MRYIGRVFFPDVKGSVAGEVSHEEGSAILIRATVVAMVASGVTRLLLIQAPDPFGSVAPWVAFLIVFAALVGLGYWYYRGEGRDTDRRSVLIVEDDDLTRAMVANFFVLGGWDVLTASTCKSALGQLDRRPDWIVLDLMLPDRGGYEVLRRVRADGLPTRVALYTGGTEDSESLAAAKDYRPDDVILKGYDIRDLMRIVAGRDGMVGRAVGDGANRGGR